MSRFLAEQQSAVALSLTTCAFCLSTVAQAGVLVVDSFTTAQTDWFTTGSGHLGERWKWNESYGNDPIVRNTLDILGDGRANIDLAASSPTNSGQFRYVVWRLTYQNFAPISVDGGAQITLRGNGTAAAFGTDTPVSNPSRFQISAFVDGGFQLNGGVAVSSQSGTLGNITFDLSGVSSLSFLRLEFSVLADGGDASLQYELDEITISPIPGPATAPLLALAGLTARGRRRK
jgi:hypothetical protein